MKPNVQQQAIPTPFFSSQTSPVQTVCTSTRSPPPSLATQCSRCSPPPAQSPSQSCPSPKIPASAPAVSCSPHTPPGTAPLQPALKQTQIDDKETESEVNKFEDEIINISADDIDSDEEFIDRELLAELDAIALKAYEEDTYSDVDVENIPNYFWEYESEDG